MEASVLRAWWFERQGLGSGADPIPAAEVLSRYGWARSVGGCNPYLALFSRAGLRRAEVDAAVEGLEIQELPSARGCTYVVPRAEFALALAVGQGFGDEAQVATARKYLGVTKEELEALRTAVLAVLEAGPLDPRELKAQLGDAVRSLGSEGKKRGTTTTLPLALGRLQTHGRIRRIPAGGRLDEQRYRYAAWSSSPLAGGVLPREGAFRALAQRYFRWAGPASKAHFQWFSGLGARAAAQAVGSLDLVPLEAGSELMMFPEDRDELARFHTPSEPHYALVGSIDGVMHLRRDVQALLAEVDRGRHFVGERGSQVGGSVVDLTSHAILDRGRLVGLWEFDPGEGRIVWNAFVPGNAELTAAIARTEAFIRDDLGDARSFSLDSPASRTPRLDFLRTAQG